MELILPIVLLAVMMFFMWRSNKKRTEQAQQMRSSLGVGVDVMTQAGIYGTIVDIDPENNVTTIETSPGTLLRVHSATIANVLTPASEVPDDASSLVGDPDAAAALDEEALRTDETLPRDTFIADEPVVTDETIVTDEPVIRDEPLIGEETLRADEIRHDVNPNDDDTTPRI